MADFSVIAQDPVIRALVQDGFLERDFHDALFPELMFRAEAEPVPWKAEVGDNQTFTANGLMQPDLKPISPGSDPGVGSWQAEQWTAVLNQYGKSIDSYMPQSVLAIASLFERNAKILGLQAAQTVNRIVRERLYNAAESGNTVADGAQIGVTALVVKRLNGFTEARRPDLANGSPVKYAAVSSNNPLKITVAGVANTVVGFTSVNPGDTTGPGTLALSAAATVADRDPVLSLDRSFRVLVGGGNRTDDIGANDILQLKDIRAAVARLRLMNIPRHSDGFYHAHFDPTSEAQLYSDPEMQRLNTSLPDYVIYKDFAITQLLGAVFFRNNECPLSTNVLGGDTATYNPADPFAPELWSNGDATTGIPIHRVLFTGSAGIYEYWQSQEQYISDAGITGKMGEPSITNNGIEVNSDRIKLIYRAPLNRFQDQVATSWRLVADWPVRTDVTTGDAAKFKRELSILHGAS